MLADFHLFMRRTRPTTVYNLLDALQAHRVRAAVIGISVEQNAVDLMEKRARSRFSHRKVILSLPHSAAADEVRSLPAPVCTCSVRLVARVAATWLIQFGHDCGSERSAHAWT